MPNSPPILSVAALNRHIRSILEHDVGEVWVEGEISNLSKPASGHYYFTLKDATAQLRCVYFKNRHTSQSPVLMHGLKIITRGRLSVYEARGDYQMIVESVSESGIGDLYQQFEQLKSLLAGKGLFEQARKRPLPKFPNQIGIITSTTAAALRDILTTLARRFPLASIVLYPSEVQGKQAATQLISALRCANQDACCDVLILARGGGSMEDLFAFNDEQLAYAIVESQIPIVSGIGHETDFTIADFVADCRAPTPTAAAETITPNIADIRWNVQAQLTRLQHFMRRQILDYRALLRHTLEKLTSPRQIIFAQWQTVDYLQSHLSRVMQQLILMRQQHLQLLILRLNANNPQQILQRDRLRLDAQYKRLEQPMKIQMQHHRYQLKKLMSTLHAVSPLATLDRGYAIVSHHEHIITDSHLISLQDILDIRLAKGRIKSRVIAID